MVDTPIGTNSPNYTLVSGDIGATVFCRVTATNAVGSAQALSNAVGPVAAAAAGAPAITTPPAVTVAPGGASVSCDTGTWTNSPTGYAYQWYSDETPDVAISGATSATYVIDGGVIAAPGTTTFDPANTAADITLSGGNLTATNNDGSRGGTRSIASASSGKKYCEVLVTTVTSSAVTVFGISNASTALDAFPGSTLDGFGMAFDGNGYISGASVGNIALGLTNGDRLCMAVDFTAEQIWFRKNGGDWNNLGTNDPVAGTGGFDFSTINAGPYYAMLSLVDLNDVCTANFGGTAYAHTPPSGFGNF